MSSGYEPRLRYFQTAPIYFAYKSDFENLEDYYYNQEAVFAKSFGHPVPKRRSQDPKPPDRWANLNVGGYSNPTPCELEIHVQPTDTNQAVEIVVADNNAGTLTDYVSTVDTTLAKLLEPAKDQFSEKTMIDLPSGPTVQRGQVLPSNSVDLTDYVQDHIGDPPKDDPDIIPLTATYGHSDILLQALHAHDTGAKSTTMRNAICLGVPDLISEKANDDVSAPLSSPTAPPDSQPLGADDRARKKEALLSLLADRVPPAPPYVLAVYCDDIIVTAPPYVLAVSCDDIIVAAPPYNPGTMRILAHGDQRLQDYDPDRGPVLNCNRERMGFFPATYVRGQPRATNYRKRLRTAMTSCAAPTVK